MTAEELLRSARVEVATETFAVVAVSSEEMSALLGDPTLSPRMSAPFMIFKDRFEVTLVLDDADFGNIRRGLSATSRYETGYRLLTFDVVMDLSVVGFMAEVARILADAGVPILPLSAFSRDHLLIKQDHLAAALKALGPHVAELC